MTYDISCSALLDYIYCERRWYLRHIEGHNPDNIYLTEGKILHDYYDECHIVKSVDKISFTNVCVHNSDLRLFGYCDLVEFYFDKCGYYIDLIGCNANVVPVEIKHGKIRDCLEYKAQLTAQAMCLEYMYNCHIDFGYIEYSETKSRVKIDIDDNLRNVVINAVTSMASKMSNVCIESPYFKYGRKCIGCSMYDFCKPQEHNIDSYLKLLWE